jgi:translation initiation factor IF-2
MSHTGTSAWWTEVQHLRGAAARTDEARRRADQADLAARRASRERRNIEAEVASTPAPTPAAAVEPRRAAEPAAAATPPRPRFEPDAPASAPRRREHAAPASAPRRLDGPPVPRRGGYGDAVAIPGRRTIEIRGRTVPAPAVPPSLELDRTRRPPRRAVERIGPRPDRLAMWALVMGLLLIAVAITTASPT